MNVPNKKKKKTKKNQRSVSLGANVEKRERTDIVRVNKREYLYFQKPSDCYFSSNFDKTLKAKERQAGISKINNSLHLYFSFTIIKLHRHLYIRQLFFFFFSTNSYACMTNMNSMIYEF